MPGRKHAALNAPGFHQDKTIKGLCHLYLQKDSNTKKAIILKNDIIARKYPV